MTKRLAFLGPPGTFGEAAALLYDREAQLLPFPSHAAVVEAVETGMAKEGVVAIENSIEGSVNEVLDFLIHESRLAIRHELVLPIEHCLLVAPGTTVTEIEVIYSHPQALGQCRRFIERCFPKAELVAALSTIAAVEEVLRASTKAAAIAPARAAELYGAEILATAIQDLASNETRFVVLAPTDHPPTGQDKTSLCFTFADDRPGLLVSVLKEFADRHINLAKVESRPAKTELGRYFFLVDLEGHRLDPLVAEALAQVQDKTALFKIFGSYPKHREHTQA